MNDPNVMSREDLVMGRWALALLAALSCLVVATAAF